MTKKRSDMDKQRLDIDHLKQAMKDAGIGHADGEPNIRRFAGLMDVAPGVADSWIKGRTLPTAANAYDMAILLKTTIGRLLGRELPADYRERILDEVTSMISPSCGDAVRALLRLDDEKQRADAVGDLAALIERKVAKKDGVIKRKTRRPPAGLLRRRRS